MRGLITFFMVFLWYDEVQNVLKKISPKLYLTHNLTSDSWVYLSLYESIRL